MQQTLSGRLAAHCGGWTGCEAGCQHQPLWRELRTATIMNKASLQEGQLVLLLFLDEHSSHLFNVHHRR